MRAPLVLLALMLSLGLVAVASADRTLSSAETSEILTKLTDQGRSTWVPAGTIEATHQEYVAAQVTDPAVISAEVQKAVNSYQPNPAWTEEMQKMALDAIPFNVRYKLGNEYTMSSNVTLKYDGASFYWEINVTGRQDSVTKDASLAGNFMTDEFNLDWNKRRVFAWDGNKYTTYSSGGQATEDTVGKLPRTLKGPLTAGLFPWGKGKFKKTDLALAKVLAKELSVNSSARERATSRSMVRSPPPSISITQAPSSASTRRSLTFCR